MTALIDIEQAIQYRIGEIERLKDSLNNPGVRVNSKLINQAIDSHTKELSRLIKEKTESGKEPDYFPSMDEYRRREEIAKYIETALSKNNRKMQRMMNLFIAQQKRNVIMGAARQVTLLDGTFIKFLLLLFIVANPQIFGPIILWVFSLISLGSSGQETQEMPQQTVSQIQMIADHEAVLPYNVQPRLTGDNLNPIPFKGIDYSAGCGQPIVSPQNGRIVDMGYDGYIGASSYSYREDGEAYIHPKDADGNTYVKFANDAGVESVVLHLQFRDGIEIGTEVTGGVTIVGYEDDIGNSTGCHVDFYTSGELRDTVVSLPEIRRKLNPDFGSGLTGDATD